MALFSSQHQDKRDGVRTHGESRFPRTRGSSNQDGASSDFAILDHLHNQACRLASLELADHALRGEAGLQGVVQAQASNVCLHANATDLQAQVAGLGCHVLSSQWPEMYVLSYHVLWTSCLKRRNTRGGRKKRTDYGGQRTRHKIAGWVENKIIPSIATFLDLLDLRLAGHLPQYILFAIAWWKVRQLKFGKRNS
jgi:hypothetical protein